MGSFVPRGIPSLLYMPFVTLWNMLQRVGGNWDGYWLTDSLRQDGNGLTGGIAYWFVSISNLATCGCGHMSSLYSSRARSSITLVRNIQQTSAWNLVLCQKQPNCSKIGFYHLYCTIAVKKIFMWRFEEGDNRVFEILKTWSTCKLYRHFSPSDYFIVDRSGPSLLPIVQLLGSWFNNHQLPVVTNHVLLTLTISFEPRLKIPLCFHWDSVTPWTSCYLNKGRSMPWQPQFVRKSWTSNEYFMDQAFAAHNFQGVANYSQRARHADTCMQAVKSLFFLSYSSYSLETAHLQRSLECVTVRCNVNHIITYKSCLMNSH